MSEKYEVLVDKTDKNGYFGEPTIFPIVEGKDAAIEFWAMIVVLYEADGWRWKDGPMYSFHSREDRYMHPDSDRCVRVRYQPEAWRLDEELERDKLDSIDTLDDLEDLDARR